MNEVMKPRPALRHSATHSLPLPTHSRGREPESSANPIWLPLSSPFSICGGGGAGVSAEPKLGMEGAARGEQQGEGSPAARGERPSPSRSSRRHRRKERRQHAGAPARQGQANVFHRDLKPKNILANSDCKLKICDFGLARASFNDAPSAIFWTDYVATRWYRAPELCGSFFSKYTPAIDIWSIGCIFAELLTGRPLFPGRNVVHQLDLITDLLGSPSSETLSRIRNEKARRYLSCMRKKHHVPFTQKFPNADPLALRLLGRLLAFDPKDRPTAEEALADPYFASLANVEREPSRHPISKLEFEFERRKLTKDDVRGLIYREILEYHPQMLQEYMKGGEQISFLYPSGVDRFKRQFAHLEEHYSKGERGSPLQRKHASLPRERVGASKDGNNEQHTNDQERNADSIARTTVSPPRSQDAGQQHASAGQNGVSSTNLSPRSYLKSASISASKCVVVNGNKDPEDDEIYEEMEEAVDGLSEKVSMMHS